MEDLGKLSEKERKNAQEFLKKIGVSWWSRQTEESKICYLMASFAVLLASYGTLLGGDSLWKYI
ncbi:MAG: hypothetical protein WCH62_09370 [Candidatus Omnitrophota bacterium]